MASDADYEAQLEEEINRIVASIESGAHQPFDLMGFLKSKGLIITYETVQGIASELLSDEPMRVTKREAHLIKRGRSLREYCIFQVFYNKTGQPIGIAIDGRFETL